MTFVTAPDFAVLLVGLLGYRLRIEVSWGQEGLDVRLATTRPSEHSYRNQSEKVLDEMLRRCFGWS